MEPIDKIKGVVEITAALVGLVALVWFYDAQVDGQMSRAALPAWQRLTGWAESKIDAHKPIALAEHFTHHPLPPRGQPWPESDPDR